MKETAVISCGIKSICSKMLHLFLVPLLPQHREVCIRFVVGRMGLGGGTRGEIENSVAMKMLREMTTAMVSVITESILTGSTKTHSNVGITPMVTMWMKTKISIYLHSATSWRHLRTILRALLLQQQHMSPITPSSAGMG